MSLHHYEENSYLFSNRRKIFKLTVKNGKVNFQTQFCLGSMSNRFGVCKSREISLEENVYNSSVDCDAIDKSDIFNIQKYLMVKNGIKCLAYQKSIYFIIIVSASNHKCFSLNNQKCITQPTLINLNLNEYSQELHHYLFAVNLDRCVGSCNTLDYLSNRVCVPNKTEHLNLRVFNIITGINKSKTLTKHISYKH